MPLQYGHANLSVHPQNDVQSGKSNLPPPTTYYVGANLIPVSNHLFIVAQSRIIEDFVEMKLEVSLHYGNSNVSADPANDTPSTHPHQTLFFMAGPNFFQLETFQLLLHNYELEQLMTDHFESFQYFNSKTLGQMPINFSTQKLLHTKKTTPVAQI